MEGPARNAIWPVLFLLSSVLVIAHGLVGVEEVDRTCQSHETCMPNCAFFKVIAVTRLSYISRYFGRKNFLKSQTRSTSLKCSGI